MLLFRGFFFCPGLCLSGHIQAGGCFVHFHYIYMSFFSGENEYYCICIFALYHTVDILWKITLGYVAEGSTSFVLHYIIRRHRCPRWSMCGRLLFEWSENCCFFFQQQLNRGNVFFKKLRKWEATFVTALLQEKGKKKTINLSTFYLVSGSQVPRLQNVSNLNRASRHFQPPPRSNKQNTNKCVSEFFPFEMWKKRGEV